MDSVSRENSLTARSIPCGVRAETICGSSNSSVIALPSAIRSGQNATPIDTPRPAIIFSTSAVTPGKTVERSTSSWPSRRYDEQVLEGLRDRRLVRVQVLIDGRADDHDHVLGRADHGRVGRGPQPTGGDGALKQRRGPALVERQLARVHALDGRLAHVVDGHPGAPVRERDRER